MGTRVRVYNKAFVMVDQISLKFSSSHFQEDIKHDLMLEIAFNI